MVKPIDQFKKTRLTRALKKTNGNRTLAADKLGISVRTVRNWINRFDLSKDYPAIRRRKSY
jgi:transcriptional regulator with PAS, ATPase and Fis domain